MEWVCFQNLFEASVVPSPSGLERSHYLPWPDVVSSGASLLRLMATAKKRGYCFEILVEGQEHVFEGTVGLIPRHWSAQVVRRSCTSHQSTGLPCPNVSTASPSCPLREYA